MRKTKIICTIGPKTESFDQLEKLALAGMNVVRLNMSHAKHEGAARIIRAIKTLNRKLPDPVAILLDTQGPEIRTGDITGELALTTGDEITISVRDGGDVEASSIRIHYDDLVSALKIGDRITVDNGIINLEVLTKNDNGTLGCKIIDGGILKSKRHVNLPGIRVNLPAITNKDRSDIAFGIEQEVDFIALSFVREAEDVRELKALLGKKAGKIKIIGKIEDQSGVANLDEILQEVDGIMVARGDLGVEINLAELPNVQRKIVRRCAEEGKRVIVATHLLESMIENPIPTRAEVTDVANAIYEEVDAVMLSGETTIGKYPIRCVEQLVEIARASERVPGLSFVQKLTPDSDKQQIAHYAVQLAESIGAKGTVVITRRGYMADFVTNCHPQKSRIYAFTNDSQTRRRLVLNRNVSPYRIAFSQDPEKTLTSAFKLLKGKAGLDSGDKVVVISDMLSGQGIEAIQVRKLP
ncbi:MAG TPA: pyruvate kinase [Gammaproteobacteria bacterium]|jgi:pyruvate kinase|nr:pyruvate kinase [Gammaproteobacteria bacterium]MDA7591418.1 pyruvate kinase [Pseudomonadales bacterium]MDA8950181.1 pyruvate kinase [Pseudomonadales bacterium]MDB4035237.1 pyruvate kinase [Pseudomonadales bacterium]HAJ28678.1 pyruvate kinase [Gammaproteobacteria bacterium]